MYFNEFQLPIVDCLFQSFRWLLLMNVCDERSLQLHRFKLIWLFILCQHMCDLLQSDFLKTKDSSPCPRRFTNDMHWTNPVGVIRLFVCVYAKGIDCLITCEKREVTILLPASLHLDGGEKESVSLRPLWLLTPRLFYRWRSPFLWKWGHSLWLQRRRCTGSPSLTPIFLDTGSRLATEVAEPRPGYSGQSAEGRTCPPSGPGRGSTRPLTHLLGVCFSLLGIL